MMRKLTKEFSLFNKLRSVSAFLWQKKKQAKARYFLRVDDMSSSEEDFSMSVESPKKNRRPTQTTKGKKTVEEEYKKMDPR